jgi:hypothetical protein
VPSTNGVHDDELEPPAAPIELTDDSLVNARHQLAEAVDDLVGVLRAPEVMAALPETDRANLAKYLTINKLKLENAIALVRSGDL